MQGLSGGGLEHGLSYLSFPNLVFIAGAPGYGRWRVTM